MSQKIYDFFKRYNFVPILAIICLFVNNVLVLVFKNTALKQTFSCRFLVLISSFVALAGALFAFYKIIYRFVNEKNKRKFILEFIAMSIIFALILWATIKYFCDFEIYFVDNNATNFLVLLSVLGLVVFEIYEKIRNMKQNLLGVCVLGTLSLIALVVMIVTYQNSDVSQFYIYGIGVTFAGILLLALTINSKLKNFLEFVMIVVAGILLLSTLITNLNNRTATDVYNMMHLFVTLASLLVLMAVGASLKHNEIVPMIFKILCVALSVFVFVKIIYFDISLQNVDLSRLIFAFVFPLLFAVAFENKLHSILLVGFDGLIAVSYAISTLIVYFQKNYETKLYIVMIVFLGVYGLFALINLAVRFSINQKVQMQDKK